MMKTEKTTNLKLNQKKKGSFFEHSGGGKNIGYLQAAYLIGLVVSKHLDTPEPHLEHSLYPIPRASRLRLPLYKLNFHLLYVFEPLPLQMLHLYNQTRISRIRKHRKRTFSYCKYNIQLHLKNIISHVRTKCQHTHTHNFVFLSLFFTATITNKTR